MKASVFTSILCVLGLACGVSQADEPSFRLGVSVAGIRVLTQDRLAGTATATFELRKDSGMSLGVHDDLTILPPTGGKDTLPGVLNRTTFAVGYMWENVSISIGPAVSLYSMAACSPVLCARTKGIAPSVDASLTVYSTSILKGALGVRAVMAWDALLGDSAVLANSQLVTVLVGPVYRFGYGVH